MGIQLNGKESANIVWLKLGNIDGTFLKLLSQQPACDANQIVTRGYGYLGTFTLTAAGGSTGRCCGGGQSNRRPGPRTAHRPAPCSGTLLADARASPG